MMQFKKSIGLVVVVSLAAAAYAAHAVNAARQLVIDGKVCPVQVTQEDGQYKVPLVDIATCFGYTMSVTGDQATLTRISATMVDPALLAKADSPSGAPSATDSAYPTALTWKGEGVAPTDAAPVEAMATPPTQITVAVGKAASLEGVDYTLTSIDEVGAKYKDVYDQRQSTLQPKWKSDSLVVLTIKETNQGAAPIYASFPGASDVTVFDGKKMGYQATGLDLARPTGVVANGSSDDTMTYVEPSTASNPILGPGGTICFAVIASVPKGDKVTSVMMKVANSGKGSLGPSGAIITILGS